MKKLFYILIMTMGISVYECYATLKTDSIYSNNNLIESPLDSLLNILTTYPLNTFVIDPLITSYYNSYLKSPENIHELINYMEDMKNYHPNDTIFPWGYITETLLPMFKTHQDSLSITHEEDIFSFALQKKIISQIKISTFSYNPCNMKLLMGEHPGSYVTIRNRFDTYRYYDQQNKAVLNPIPLQEQLDKKRRELQITYLMPDQYKSFTYEDYAYPIYLVLEYRLSDGLRLFCENKPFHTDLEYFRKLEEYLAEFCEEHSLSRIVFLSPEYH